MFQASVSIASERRKSCDSLVSRNILLSYESGRVIAYGNEEALFTALRSFSHSPLANGRSGCRPISHDFRTSLLKQTGPHLLHPFCEAKWEKVANGRMRAFETEKR
jgi:hypothetical protein